MVYIEYVLGLNAVIHVMLVYVTGIIINSRIRRKYLIISVILDSIYMFFYMYHPTHFEIIKYGFGIVLMFVTFFKTGIKNMVKASFIYYLQNFILGGISSILYMSTKLNVYGIIIIIIVNLIVTYIYKEKTRVKVNINNLNYELMIVDHGEKYFINGYCDTGNFLLSEDMISVVFINSKFKFGSFVKTLDSQSIGVRNNLNLFKVDEFYIKKNDVYEKKDVYIAFCDLHFDGMFGLNLLGG